MSFDLLAGAAERPIALAEGEQPRILTFDSGLGGLTVLAALMRLLPGARHVFLADDAAFPYGSLAEDALVDRVSLVLSRAIERHRPHIAVIACNTASTLVLPVLRARFAIPFVGTVPAVRLAAASSRSQAFAVLATPGTIARDYTRRLIEAFAGQCAVTLVASERLAGFAETVLTGGSIPDETLRREISPCFVDHGTRKVDTVVLACTHYPLLIDHLARIAPWPVSWIDPAPFIAKRVAVLVPDHARIGEGGAHLAVFTRGGGLTPQLRARLLDMGLGEVAIEPSPVPCRSAV